MTHRLTVVVSQSRGPHPAKRALEQKLIMELLDRNGLDVKVTAHLYDLPSDSTGLLCLAGITGDLVVCSWLYPRATRWILDRNGIRGLTGSSQLKAAGEDEAKEQNNEALQDSNREKKTHVIDKRELPDRRIHCLDLRAYDSADVYIEEIDRIALEQKTQTVELAAWVQGDPKPEAMAHSLSETNVSPGNNGHPQRNGNNTSQEALPESEMENQLPLTSIQNPESVDRRWYPVIDFSRCTNCLECIDFCLFGVYGLDGQETILVEQPDHCRLGCPACSRVCPENAIIFPQHKVPTIAGSPETGGSMKIDLSQLFGAPANRQNDSAVPSQGDLIQDALETAVHERDEHLRLAGRETVGKASGTPKRQTGKSVGHSQDASMEKLDRLIDAVDELDL